MVHGGNVPSVEEGSTPNVAVDPVLESIPYRVGAKRCLWRGGSCQADRCCPDFVDDPGTRVAPRGGPGRPHAPTPSQPCHVHCLVMRAMHHRIRSGTHTDKRAKLYGFEFGNKMNEIRLRGSLLQNMSSCVPRPLRRKQKSPERDGSGNFSFHAGSPTMDQCVFLLLHNEVRT